MGVGNVYRHSYENVAEQQLWLTVHDHLPALLTVIDAEIEKLDDASTAIPTVVPRAP
ncbi:MAG TPA: hypothetical protein VED87_05120 [Methylocystis sp.]|nr:hypothetical protein [Methylocystis sp.]